MLLALALMAASPNGQQTPARSTEQKRAPRPARLAISRLQVQIDNLKALKPGFEPFDNNSRSFQPYLKVSSQLSPRHDLMAAVQFDRQRNNSDRELEPQRLNYSGYGGGMVTGRLTSVWTNRLSTQLLASWNNKSRENS